MSVASILFKCLPFFGFAGIGVYMLCVAFFPSWREPGWRHWKSYASCDDVNPNSWSTALGFSKPPKPVAQGDLPEETARGFYLCLGLVALVIAFIGIRHFAGIPETLPDILGILGG